MTLYFIPYVRYLERGTIVMGKVEAGTLRVGE